jgi:hypothetical protein
MIGVMWRLLFVLASVGCASAGHSSPTSDAPPHNGDGPVSHDGGVDSSIDAPPGSCASPTSGMLASWAFTGEPGSQAMTAATTMATGITAGAVSRGSGLTVASGVGSINSSNWATGSSLDSSKYYTLAITPPSGCLLDLTSMSITTAASSTGPKMAVAATSIDSFGQTSTVNPNGTGTATLTVSGATAMVEVRVFGFGASSTSGTMRISGTLAVTGALH